MKRHYHFIIFAFGLSLFYGLTACNQAPRQKEIPVIGEVDSAFIAADTTMQLGLESSYEYQHTLVVHPKLVYDIIGWGTEYAEGEFAIVKRGADNKPDTVVKDKRIGIIENSMLTNLEENPLKHAEPQVLLFMRQPGTGVYGNVLVYQTPEFKKISFDHELPSGFQKTQYMGHDSFYVHDNKLYREFPVYKKGDANCCASGGRAKVTYTIKNAVLHGVSFKIN